MGQTSSTVALIASAIQRNEGYYPGSVAYRNNNPGNLRPLKSGTWPGQDGVANGYAVFATYADGLAALNSQIQTNIDRGLTLTEFFAGKPGVYAGYAPAADSNQPRQYAANVASWTGLPLDVPLNQLGSTATPITSGPVAPILSDQPVTLDTSGPMDTSGTIAPSDTTGDGTGDGTDTSATASIPPVVAVIGGAAIFGFALWAWLKG